MLRVRPPYCTRCFFVGLHGRSAEIQPDRFVMETLAVSTQQGVVVSVSDIICRLYRDVVSVSDIICRLYRDVVSAKCWQDASRCALM